MKMNLLPRLLYLFQAISIQLPLTFFSTYKKICRLFIWSSKPPRLNRNRLTIPKLQGGLHIPDIQKYYWVCHLSRIVDWHVHSNNKDWVHIENVFSPIPLQHLPWINPNKIPKVIKLHPLINTTLLNFKAACKPLQLRPTPGPMTPLEDNPDFEPGLSLHNPTVDPQRPRRKIQQRFHNEVLLTHQVMSSKFPEYHIPFYKYLQICHYIQSCKSNASLHRKLTPFERLCNSTEPQQHLISTIYVLLFSTHEVKKDELVRQ